MKLRGLAIAGILIVSGIFSLRMEELGDVYRERMEISPLDVAPVGLWLSDGDDRVYFDGPWRPCSTEDSAWCTWNAQAQGNGQGRSFVALWEGATLYLSEPAKDGAQ